MDDVRFPLALLTEARDASRPLDHVGCHESRSMRVTICRNSGPCQVAFGELEAEVSGMPDEASPGLEEPLLEARQRPVLPLYWSEPVPWSSYLPEL